MIQLNIKTKILLLALGITAFMSISIFIAADRLFKKGEAYVIEQSIMLGDEAAEKSGVTLETQAKRNLIHILKIQAQSSDNFFRTVRMEVEGMVRLSQLFWPDSNEPSSTNIPGETLLEKAALPGSYETNGLLWEGYIPPPGFLYRLAPNVDSNTVKEELQSLQSIGAVFYPFLSGNPYQYTFFLGSESGINLIWPDTKGKDNHTYDPRTRPWYVEALERKDVGWTGVFRGATTETLMIGCAGPVYDHQEHLKGVVGASITLDHFFDVISSQVKGIGKVFVLDENGRLIPFSSLDQTQLAIPPTNKEDRDFASIFDSENSVLKTVAQKMIKGENDFSKINFNTEEHFIGYAPINEIGWSMAIIIPAKEALAAASQTREHILHYTDQKKDEIARTIHGVKSWLIFFFIFMIGLAVGIAVKISNRISRPILELTRAVVHVGKGELDTHIEIRTGDEIETLAEAFNKMTRDLQGYIDNLRKTTAAKEKIESELQLATRIQNSMLPRVFPPFPKRTEFDIFASMVPAREVGGDLYDFFFISETKFCFLVGDVSGKGIPASLFMVVAKTLIKNEALRGISPQEILCNVNNALCEDNDECMFVTGIVCIVDLKTGMLIFANAGHNPPLIWNEKKEAFDFVNLQPGFVMGGMPDFEYQTQSMQLHPGDILFLYTDGVNEAMDMNGKEYSDQRLKLRLSEGNKDMTPHEMIQWISQDIEGFVNGAEQSDDITMLAFQYKGTTGNRLHS